MILTTRPATLADAEYIGANMRAEDAREVSTATGLPGEQAVPLSFSLARESYVWHLATPRGTVEDKPCAIFGVCDDPSDKDIGIIWLLGTPAVQRGALAIMREAPRWLDRFNSLYPRCIHNLVDSRNDLHTRWLLLTGFTFADDIYTIQDVPFIHAMRFTRHTIDV